jgi:hypothetical protein
MFKLSHIGALAALTLASTPFLNAAACVSGTEASYAALGAGGCTITSGGVTLDFTGFVLTQAAGAGDSGGTPALLLLTPDITGGIGFDITDSGTPWSAAATSTNDDDLAYVVTVVGGADILNSMYISETGSAGAAIGGGSPGTDTITETLCPGGTIPPGSCPSGGVSNGGSLQIVGPASGVTEAQTLSYSLTNSLSVDKDIQIGLPGGASTGASSLTDVKNLLNPVPEPSTYGFLAIACCALIGFKKYQQKKTA